MGIRDWFRRVLACGGHDHKSDRPGVKPATRETTWRWPPTDVHDRDAWDEYWKSELQEHAEWLGFSDFMANDPTLPGLLTRRGARTILCAGNGLSTEALSLALHGFDVTALDISSVPAEYYAERMRRPWGKRHQIPGFAIRDDGSFSMGAPGTIDPEHCPRIHQSPECPNKGGGSLSFVTGDLTDPGLCPGPFDVVIERRTVQLFQPAERAAALERLVARLQTPGTLVSHQHNGGWKPGDDRTHYAASWLTSRGFIVLQAGPSAMHDACPRLACLRYSTG
jgi:hypothetical protein